MRNRNTQGFTLIELLIVIAIIGILAAVLIPNLLNARARAYDSGAQTCANSMQTAQEINWLDSDTYVGAADPATTTADADGQQLQDLATACADIVAAGGTVAITAGDETGWTGTVQDIRGTQTYTVTESTLTP